MKTRKFSLYNVDISDNYRNEKFYLMLGDFTGAMAYYLAHDQHKSKININKPLKAFSKYLQQKYFKTHDTITEFTYKQLSTLISEDIFIAIPELLALNQIKSKEFYDLWALSQNIFFMICRQKITQSY